MKPTDCEVLVIGGGPTGLALACALRLHDVHVRVIDAASRPAVTSRANILHARGVEVLDRLGALGDLPERAQPALTITLYLDGKPAVTIRFGDLGLGQARPALYISQAEIEAALRARLGELGSEVEWGTELNKITEGDKQVTATLDDGQTIACSWIVGCDGAHSTVRQLTDIGFPGVPVSERFLLADVHADWPVSRSGGHGWPHEDGPFFAMPMPDPTGRDDLWRMMAYDAESRGEMSDQDILDRFRQLARERTGRTDIEIKNTVWASTFRAHRRLANTYRRDRVFIAGDAAHIHSPLGGQGMVTGIGDAENLGWKLALVIQGTANDKLLDTYEAERRPVATDVLRSTTGATRVQVGKGPVMRFLRNWVLVPLANLPSVQKRAGRMASQLWVSYRKGPLARRTGIRFGARPRPGDRMPDLPCHRSDGSHTRLHRELGGHWALLGKTGEMQDYLGEARDRLGDRVMVLEGGSASEVWLVRPDAHLAWRGPKGPKQLGRWLDGALQSGKDRI